MDNIVKIVLIGAGQLGSRHLQGLALLDRPAKIEVVEPSYQSVERAKERLKQVSSNTNIQAVEYYTNIQQLSDQIDVAIIATNANIRRSVIESLITNRIVKYLLLEKVVFQNEEDFAATNDLLEQNSTKAWVNCPRRMWPFYQLLQKKLSNAEMVELQEKGSQWGLGCNAIHMLDLYAFLTGETAIQLSGEYLDERWIASKRPGFVEFTGSLLGKTSRGRIRLISQADGDIPDTIEIYSDRLRCFINESIGQAWLAEKEDNWQWQNVKFQVLYQSQLTHLALQDILDTGTSKLATYEESRKLHIPLLRTFTRHLRKYTGEDVKECPIT